MNSNIKSTEIKSKISCHVNNSTVLAIDFAICPVPPIMNTILLTSKLTPIAWTHIHHYNIVLGIYFSVYPVIERKTNENNVSTRRARMYFCWFNIIMMNNWAHNWFWLIYYYSLWGMSCQYWKPFINFLSYSLIIENRYIYLYMKHF
jgi:hypothetical protein